MNNQALGNSLITAPTQVTIGSGAGGGPSGDNILTELSDNLQAENGDLLILE